MAIDVKFNKQKATIVASESSTLSTESQFELEAYSNEISITYYMNITDSSMASILEGPNSAKPYNQIPDISEEAESEENTTSRSSRN